MVEVDVGLDNDGEMVASDGSADVCVVIEERKEVLRY